MINLSGYLDLEHRYDGSFIVTPHTEYLVDARSVELDMDHRYGWSGPDHSRHAPVVSRHRLSMDMYHIPPPPPPKRRSVLDLGLRRPK